MTEYPPLESKGLLLPFHPAADEYPNHLAVPRPERLSLPKVPWTLAAMVLLCLLPRAMMALRITSVSPDGVIYIHAAKAVESGNLREAFRAMDLNLYPLILAALHRLGFDWELGAMCWGVAISSLVVLPLWGWLRRQFDDRVALLACMLYAVHPKFIEWSPEVMRDPTFWLLFMLAIHWMWRGVTEVRHRWFIAAGGAIILASLTRIEGVFLLTPLALWTFWRWRALKKVSGTFFAKRFLTPFSARGKLLLGAALCVTVFPALLLLVNLIWLHGRFGWTLLRLDPVARVQPWLEHLFGNAAAEGGGAAATGMSVGRMAWIFFPTMTKGLSPIFALLMFGGIWGWRRAWTRRDHQPLFYTALVIMLGIWVQLWYGRNICPRYALPIVLMAMPWASLGLLGLTERLVRLTRRRWPAARPGTIAAVVFGALFAANLTDAMTCNRSYFAGRRTAVEVGRWARREFHHRPVLVGPPGVTPIAAYYADAAYRMFRCDAGDRYILTMIEKTRPDAVLLRPAKQLTERRCASLVERARRTGMVPLRDEEMPTEEPGFIILVRGE